MRLRALLAVICTSLCVFSMGCLRAPVRPPVGKVFSSYQAPLDYDLDNTEVGSRFGISTTHSLLGLVTVGDASVREAARRGRLEVIYGADYEFVNIFIFYQRYRTIVYGE